MKRIIIAMTLTLALVLGTAALAEGMEPDLYIEQGEQAAPMEAPEAEVEDAAADDAAALEEAFEALREARLSAKLDELQAELDGYVAAGKLTQEQADLIMNSIRERLEAKQVNGGCDCGQMQGKQQCPGMQGGNRQFGQMPGNQQDGNNQFPGQR